VSAKVAFPLTIDRMAYDEAEPVSLLFTQVLMALPYYNEVAKKAELEKYSPALLCDSISKEPDSVLVAKASSQMVGFCLSHYDDGLIWLSWFGVHPSYRHGGIGSALLKALEERVRARRLHKIWCDSRTENEASRSVLTSCGYTQLCIVRNHWYGQDFILWEKLV